jgi:L-amino acid N-acyltransferase YncA
MEVGNEASEALHRKFGFIEIGRLKEAGFKFNR